MAIKPSPALPNIFANASATSAVFSFVLFIAPVSRSTSPDERTANAVSEQTTMVSANTSKIPHMPCLTGSLTSELE